MSLSLDYLPVVTGRGRAFRRAFMFAGPSVIASIAYMDPGNFATNIQAGAAYGYDLLWVVLAASLVAMLFQALSARLGIVTGRNLAELCRDELPAVAVYPMWGGSELATMATDLAEFLGAALGLGRRGYRPMELLIGGFVGIIALCYTLELFLVPDDWPAVFRGMAVPTIPDNEALVLAVGIIGATVMPHAIFLHSGLTQNRIPAVPYPARPGGAAPQHRSLGDRSFSQ